MFKLFKRKYLGGVFGINSFCRECGRDVHDFDVDDDIWNKVEPSIKYGNTLCYDCFCEKCKELNLSMCWSLLPIQKVST